MSSDFPQFAVRDFKIQRRGRQRERQKKNNWFNKQNNNFASASRFFVHFFARFCTTTTWKCLISRFMEDVNKQRRNFISLSELGYQLLKIKLQADRLHSVWQRKWVGIIAFKTERTQIHFLSDMTLCYVLWVISTNRSRSTRTPLNLLKGTEVV